MQSVASGACARRAPRAGNRLRRANPAIAATAEPAPSGAPFRPGVQSGPAAQAGEAKTPAAPPALRAVKERRRYNAPRGREQKPQVRGTGRRLPAEAPMHRDVRKIQRGPPAGSRALAAPFSAGENPADDGPSAACDRLDRRSAAARCIQQADVFTNYVLLSMKVPKTIYIITHLHGKRNGFLI